MAQTSFTPVTSPAAWQHTLAQLPGAHALQSWTWAQFKSRWGWQMLPLTLSSTANQEPVAAAMVLKRKIPRLPFCVLYVPKGPVLAYQDAHLRQTILSELEKVAKRERAIFLKIDPEVVSSRGLEQEWASPIALPFTQELQARGWRFSDDQIQFRNTVTVDLSQTEADLLAAMKPKTRYNIGLALRKGITVRIGTPADFPALAQMYRETAARDGFGIRPSAYYLDAWQSFYDAGMGQTLIAEYAAEPIAAVYLVQFQRKTIYMYGASTEKERNRMPNYLLQWEAMRQAKAQGHTLYDFWGAPDEFVESDRLWGVWRFKSGFNGEVVRHIGAWDYVARPLAYWLYTAVIPEYLKMLRANHR